MLLGATAGGPDGRALFDLTNVGIETACLLASSFACGVAGIGVERQNQFLTQGALIVTGLLGVAFLSLELREFAEMVAKGAGPGRSAFLSSFFGLVGCHGLHIGLGLIWLGTMMAQFLAKGFSEATRYRFLCFSLFWHALDIVWVAIFTLVYLIGAGS